MIYFRSKIKLALFWVASGVLHMKFRKQICMTMNQIIMQFNVSGFKRQTWFMRVNLEVFSSHLKTTKG